jgi:hypothetical protein
MAARPAPANAVLAAAARTIPTVPLIGQYQPSPFYRVAKMLSPSLALHRTAVRTDVVLDASDVALLRAAPEPSHQIRLMCARADTLMHVQPTPIDFPRPTTVFVNEKAVPMVRARAERARSLGWSVWGYIAWTDGVDTDGAALYPGQD